MQSCRCMNVIATLAYLWITCVISMPTPNKDTEFIQKTSRSSKFDAFSDNVQNYLMDFGYLPKSNIETGNLRTVDQLHAAIKTLQKYGNIPQTGEMDDATRELIRRPRCAVPDNPDSPDFHAGVRMPYSFYENKRHKRYLIQGPKWQHTDLTWSLVNQTMNHETLHAGHVRRILTDALDVWAKSSKLTFREVNSKEADIQVLFARGQHGDGYNFDGPGLVLAHAFYPGPNRGGDAHFDEDEHWLLDESSDDGTSLMLVAVHEFGHSLGLGHSSVEGSIMYPWYHGYQGNKDLPDDDRIAIQSIYGPNEKQWASFYPREPPPPPRPTTTTTTTRRPHYPTYHYYPDREYPGRHPSRKNPNNNPKVYTEKPYEAPKKPYPYPKDVDYPTYQPTNPPRRYPSYPREKIPVETPRRNHPAEHPRHNHTEHPRHHNGNEKPKICDTSYDAISLIRGELFIFKDRYLWRIGPHSRCPHCPYEITQLWSELPSNLTHIDAVYENKKQEIVFFIGRYYYVFNSNTLKSGYPKPLTSLGLPPVIEKLDAVLKWGYNNRTYFYSGTLYWKFDEDVNHVELDYPRDMSIWYGIGYYIDTAFQYKDGKTYFFKGKHFWKFDDYNMRVISLQPKSSAVHWMGCPHGTHSTDNEHTRQKEPLIAINSVSSIHRTILQFNLIFITILLTRIFTLQ